MTKPRSLPVAVSYYVMRKIPYLAAFLNADCVSLPYFSIFAKRYGIYAGWGYRPFSLKTARLAAQNDGDFFYLEDGFLRSLYPSHLSPRPFSLTIDARAPHYDGSQPSDLENLIRDTKLNAVEREKAEKGIALFVKNRLSKYCVTAGAPPDDFSFPSGSAVILDQIAGDLSLQYGGISAESCKILLETALKNHPEQNIYLKTHPDILTGKKKSCFSDFLNEPRLKILPQINLNDLYGFKPVFYVLTSLAGFEAALNDCSVHVFGKPWYAGWSVTRDYAALERRTPDKTILDLFHAAYLKYNHYADPDTGKPSDFFTVAGRLSIYKQRIEKISGILYAFGFSRWKRRDILLKLKTPYNRVIFCSTVEDSLKNGFKTEKNAKIIVWGYRAAEILEALQKIRPNAQNLRVEDGFIRSVGLGSDFTKALSVAVDSGNLYYNPDPENPSDLQGILDHIILDESQTVRTRNLIQLINENDITKYNGPMQETCLDLPKGRKIIFVPGQVDDDASIRYGGVTGVMSCLELLQAARADNPDAFILFRPHPDVTAGNRIANYNFRDLEKLCDRIETDGDVLTCIKAADEVHILTSLTGFDALLRGKKVVTYGKPFFAGRGLTRDTAVFSPSRRIVTLEELVYGCLIEYPIYGLSGKQGFVEVETVIREIIRTRSSAAGAPRFLPDYIMRRIKQALRWICS